MRVLKSTKIATTTINTPLQWKSTFENISCQDNHDMQEVEQVSTIQKRQSI
jgi:hypothetical protein